MVDRNAIQRARAKCEDIYQDNKLAGKTPREIDLNFVLGAFAQEECQDPRDIFYSIRSMVEAPHTLPQIRYDLSVESVFRQHIEYLLECGAGASMLQHGGLINGSQHVDVPSWCPAWTPLDPSAVPRRYFVDLNESATTFMESNGNDVSIYKQNTSPLRAGGERQGPYTYSVVDDSLIVEGIVLGRVLETQPGTPYAYSILIPDTATEKVSITYSLRSDRAFTSRRWSKQILPSECQFYLDQDEVSPNKAIDDGPYLKCRHGVLGYWITVLYMSQERLSKKISEDLLNAKQTQQMNELLPKRMLCAMKPEHEMMPRRLPDDDLTEGAVRPAGFPVGLVPYNTEKGDLVVVFKGVASPMVIRKFSRSQLDQGNHDQSDSDWDVEMWKYQVVGEAYFTQYANGQAMESEPLRWKPLKLV